MRTLKRIVLLIILPILTNCSNQDTASLKVMTWNIWHGGLLRSQGDTDGI